MELERKTQITTWWEKWEAGKWIYSIDEILNGAGSLKYFAKSHGISREEMEEIFKDIVDLQDQLR